MLGQPSLMIGAIAGLVTASAYGFVIIFKELRAWRSSAMRKQVHKDIFESPFRTVHAKGFPQDFRIEVDIAAGDKKKEKTLAVCQDRPTPVFLEGEQPWRTVTDMPNAPRGLLGAINPDLVRPPFALT